MINFFWPYPERQNQHATIAHHTTSNKALNQQETRLRPLQDKKARYATDSRAEDIKAEYSETHSYQARFFCLTNKTKVFSHMTVERKWRNI